MVMYWGGGGKIEDRIANRAKHGPLVRGWQKACVPVGGPTERSAARVIDHDEGGQVAVLAAEPIGHPGPDARETP